MIGRVVKTIKRVGPTRGSNFETKADRARFRDELKLLLVTQCGALNSPVWFNCGFEEAPHCSALRWPTTASGRRAA